MIACDRCKHEFKSGRAVKLYFDAYHKAAPRMRCVNVAACDRRMHALAWKDPAALLSGKQIVGFKAEAAPVSTDDEVLVFIEDGITVVAGAHYIGPEECVPDWRIDMAHEDHPEVADERRRSA